MAEVLAPLRPELDIMPSPAPEQPGLLMRDPYRYSDAVIIVPPLLAQTLVLFDGEHTDADLKVLLTRATGDIVRAADIARDLIKVLEESGFLQSNRFFDVCDRKRREFAEAEIREPAHAGSGYPDDAEELSAKLAEYGADPETSGVDSLVAIAAPHVSPEGGFKSYGAAYRRLNPSYADKTFVILGTSHYGEPEKFGLTRKPYQTPFGAIETDRTLVDRLEQQAADAIEMEDYCHSSEHSIEFQCVFLAHVLGTTDFKILPILCGPLAESLYTGKAPESNDSVRGFFDALGELADTRRKDIIWVLGIDMAHIGRRYGDPTAALADQGHMMEVRERDVDRLARVCAGDAEGFFDLVHPNRDDLRWCGYSPVYTFLSAVKGVEGKVLNYEQWNIDEESVVSFAGVEFRESGSSAG
jgi:AmmeMemoRadiSam system protein B